MVVDLDVDELARKAYPQYRALPRRRRSPAGCFDLLAHGFTALELQEKSLDRRTGR